MTSQKQLYMLLKLWAEACKVQSWKNSTESRRRYTAEVLGEEWSWKDLTNSEVDKLKDALTLSCERVHANRDDTQDLKRTAFSIRRIAEAIAIIEQCDADAYIRRISNDQTDHEWTGLPLKQLVNLRNTLKNRLSKKITRIKEEGYPDRLLGRFGQHPNDAIISEITTGHLKLSRAIVPKIELLEIDGALCPF
jgi:hypothetical protein